MTDLDELFRPLIEDGAGTASLSRQLRCEPGHADHFDAADGARSTRSPRASSPSR